jgi:hypothetical protein
MHFLRSFFLLVFGLVFAGGGVGIAWALLSNLMMAHAKAAERDLSNAFIYTNQMIAGGFGPLISDESMIAASPDRSFFNGPVGI